MLRILAFIILWHIVTGHVTWNHSVAEEQCKDFGGLLSFKRVTESIKNGKDPVSLSEEDSVWLSGRVEFSRFVSWHGCYSRENREAIVYKQILKKNNIFNCLKNCSSLKDATSIGLRNKTCYCFKFEKIYYSNQQESSCARLLTRLDFLYDAHSFSKYISVYEIIDQRRLQWLQNSPSYFGQCVSVRTVYSVQNFQAQSCTTRSDGFICTYSVFGKMDASCSRDHEGTDRVCIVSSTLDWSQSADQCKQYSGKLISSVDPQTHAYLSTNKTYWTGIFRSYEIVSDDSSEVQPACVAVTKVDNNLIVHPDNCSLKKLSICGKDLTRNTITERKPSGHGESTTVNQQTLTEDVFSSTAPEPTSGKEDTNENSELTVVCIVIGVVCVAGLSVLIIWFVRRKIVKPRTDQCSVGKDDEEDGYAACDDPNSREIPQLQDTAESPLTVSRDECEYDRVCLNNPGRSGANNAAKTSDTHLYGHHPRGDGSDENSDYDHLGAVSSKASTKPLAGVYSTTADVTGVYNVLGSDDTVAPDDIYSDKKHEVKHENNSLYDKSSE